MRKDTHTLERTHTHTHTHTTFWHVTDVKLCRHRHDVLTHDFVIARKSRKDGETLSQGQGPCTCPWLRVSPSFRLLRAITKSSLIPPLIFFGILDMEMQGVEVYFLCLHSVSFIDYGVIQNIYHDLYADLYNLAN